MNCRRTAASTLSCSHRKYFELESSRSANSSRIHRFLTGGSWLFPLVRDIWIRLQDHSVDLPCSHKYWQWLQIRNKFLYSHIWGLRFVWLVDPLWFSDPFFSGIKTFANLQISILSSYKYRLIIQICSQNKIIFWTFLETDFWLGLFETLSLPFCIVANWCHKN